MGNGGRSSTVTLDHPSRNIAMLMAFTVGFAILGQEIKNVQNPPVTTAGGVGIVTSGGRIIIGGFLAGGFLMAITHAGSGAAQFAQGLAVVSAATSILVYGGPVWTLLNNVVKSSGNGNQPTTATTASTPTHPQPAVTAATHALNPLPSN